MGHQDAESIMRDNWSDALYQRVYEAFLSAWEEEDE